MPCLMFSKCFTNERNRNEIELTYVLKPHKDSNVTPRLLLGRMCLLCLLIDLVPRGAGYVQQLTVIQEHLFIPQKAAVVLLLELLDAVLLDLSKLWIMKTWWEDLEFRLSHTNTKISLVIFSVNSLDGDNLLASSWCLLASLACNYRENTGWR